MTQNEDDRLAGLHRYQILDSAEEEQFEDIVSVVRNICAVPIALVSLVDRDRQWFKAASGVDVSETERDTSVCALAIEGPDLFVIPDLGADVRTADMSLVTGPAQFRFYAGAPLITSDGVALGSLCAIDTVPRPDGLSEEQRVSLSALGRHVTHLIEMRLLAAREQAAQVAQRETEAKLRDLASTLERRVEERTHERDRLWRNSQDLQTVTDADGVFMQINPAFTNILGWSQDEVVGRSIFEFVVPDDEVVTDRALRQTRRDVLLTVENRYRHKEGGSRWFSWVAAPEGGLIYASGRHVTAEKEQADALATAEDALRQAQKMEAVGQLTGGLAHDFNNLLAGISGSLELIKLRLTQGRTNDVERYVAAAQGASKRAAALTHRLLAFSRRQTLDPKPTNVNRLAAGMVDLVRRTVGPAVELEIVEAAGLWPALVDPPQLENALLNLCINARDAMPDGGRITIETANKWIDRHGAMTHDLPEGQYLSLCVTDTGSGMAPEIKQRVFEPFFTTKPIGEGTGLGLSMIYGFAKQSGGQVRIYSEIGEGTTVCIYLPRHHTAGGVEDAPATTEALFRSDQGETVLIVDDEPTVRMLVTDVLQDLGYAVIEAEDSIVGLRVLESNVRIDLLVSDVGLPGGMNGRQMADAARKTRPALKVLFITGYAENAAVGNGHLSPGMAVMTKPFPVDALATRVREMIASEVLAK